MAAYGTAALLRARINKTDIDDDATLTALIAAASTAIDKFTNHFIAGIADFYAFDASDVATARVYPGTGKGFQWIDENVDVTAVSVKTSPTATAYTAWVAADWMTFRGSVRDADFNGTPYTGIMVDPNRDYSVFTLGAIGVMDDYFSDLSIYTTRNGTRARSIPTVQVTAKWGVTASPPQEIVECTYMLATRWWKRFESSMSDTLATSELGNLFYTRAVDPDIGFILTTTRWMRPAVGKRV